MKSLTSVSGEFVRQRRDEELDTASSASDSAKGMANDAPVPLGADSLFRLTRRKTTLFVHFSRSLSNIASAGPQKKKSTDLKSLKIFARFAMCNFAPLRKRRVVSHSGKISVVEKIGPRWSDRKREKKVELHPEPQIAC